MQEKNKRITFGLIIDMISAWGDGDYYQAIIISGVADYAKANDINLMCFVVGKLDSPLDWERSRNLLFNFVHENHIDGLIVLTTAIGLYETEERILSLLDGFKNIPLVTLSDGYGKYHEVTSNNYMGIYDIVSHVIEVHHRRRLAFIGGPKNANESQLRFQAFYDALNDHHIPYISELTFEGNFLCESGNAAIEYFSEHHLEFDALICANDNMALGALTELYKRTGSIPDHISITGFDDVESSKFHRLTTVRQPFYEQAQASSEMLYRLIKGEDISYINILPVEVILRSSCGCPGTVHNSSFTQLSPQEYESLQEVCLTTKDKIIAELETINHLNGLPVVNEDYENILHFENEIIDALRTGASKDHLSFVQSQALESFSEDLMSNLDWKMQMDAIYQVLPHFNIKKGFVSIYEDRNQPLKNSRLLLAYNNHRSDLGEQGMIFETLNILPACFMNALYNERFNIIIMALHQGDRPLGYTIFSFEDKLHKIYEIARYNIGVALNGSLLVESIKNQALDLERQVEERTRELSEINNTLTHEIGKRKKAQVELGEAMMALERHNTQLKTESMRDELTGLYNRRGFIELVTEYIENAMYTNNQFLLLFGDLDGLKQINDQFGHTEGDFAIKQTAEILRLTFKQNCDIISRLSGDEFTVVISGASSHDQSEISKKLKLNCDTFNSTTNKPYTLSLSTGFAYFNPKEPLDFDALLSEADNALYKEKRKKKSGVLN